MSTSRLSRGGRVTRGVVNYLNKLPAGVRPPGGFVADRENAFAGWIWSRLPEHYKAFYRQWSKGPEATVHQDLDPRRYVKDELGRVVEVQNVRFPIIYPDEFHRGLWGGEGLVKGSLEAPYKTHKNPFEWPLPQYWWPKLHQGVVYSEVLDKHMKVTMTERGQRLIDEAYGLDAYLLSTPVNEVYSLLALKMKRQILLQLPKLKESPDSERREVYLKFARFEMPEEEALWHGLSKPEAVHRQRVLEDMALEDDAVPTKHAFRRELLETLKTGELDTIDPTVIYDSSKDNVGVVQALRNTFGFGRDKKRTS